MNIPTVPFKLIAARVAAYCDPFQFNPHHGFMATTRSGKSFLIRYGLLPVYGRARIVVFDVKPGGARTWDGYGNTVTELKSGFGTGPDGSPHYRLMVQTKAQAETALDVITTEGSCIVVIDDARKLTANKPDYGLVSPVDNLLMTGAETGITVIMCANSGVWAPSSLRDQCGKYWVGGMANEDERKRFMVMAGLPKETLPILGSLRHREFLYSDRHSDGELKIAKTMYEPES